MYELKQISEKCYYINCPAKIGVYVADKDNVYLVDSGNGNRTNTNKPFGNTALSRRSSAGGRNTLGDLLSGHYKNSYGVEGMCVTGRSDYKKIIPVSDEMKQHVLEDVKMAYYKYNGMSGDNEAEWDAYYRKNNEYYKTLKKEDRLSA